MKSWIRCIIAAIHKGIWLPLLVFILHVLCANIGGNLYDLYPPLDIPMHFLGGVAIGYFGAVLVRQCSESGFIAIKSEIVSVAFILALTVTAATFWEYAEWISDHTIGTQSQKGLDDTLFDMLIGFVGGGLFVMVSKGKQIVRELSQREN
jgi:hypothetical protein